MSKNPPGILALVDYKAIHERITFAEVLAYNDLSAHYPLYIVRSTRPESGPFLVYIYVGGDWRPEPPEVIERHVLTCQNWEELSAWEQAVRLEYERRRAADSDYGRSA